MYDSNEAAQIKTVTGWVSRTGQFWGDNEDAARYSGCTHKPCRDCGVPVEKGWLICASCRSKSHREKWENMPFKDWGGEPLYCMASGEYYWSEDDIEYALDDGREVCDLMLVICEPE